MKNKIRTSYQKHRMEIRFILIIMLFGLFSGLVFYLKQDSVMKASLSLNMEIFSHNVFRFSNIIYHLLAILSLIALSFLLIGFPLLIVYIFLESLSVGFLIPLLFSSFKLSGIGIYISYFLLKKLGFFILLLVLFCLDLAFIKDYLLYLKNHKNKFFGSLKKVLITLFIIVANDFLVYFVMNRFLSFILV